VAACVNLPIVVIHGRQFGFGAFFYVALAHWLLYMCRPPSPPPPTPQLQPNASQVCRVSRRSLMAQALCNDRRLQPPGDGRAGHRRPAHPPLHLLPSLAQRRGTPHPPPRAPPHRVGGRLVRAARCCPRQQPVPHSGRPCFQRVLPSDSRRGSSGAAAHVRHVTPLAPPPCKR
jgi:hypothetical protein